MPKIHGQMSATTRPTRIARAQLGVDGVANPPVSQYTIKKAITPRMIPVIRRIIASLQSLAGLAHGAQRLRREPRRRGVGASIRPDVAGGAQRPSGLAPTSLLG